MSDFSLGNVSSQKEEATLVAKAYAESVPTDDYKTTRLQELAELWKGTTLEKHTVPLLAMLLTEDGTLTAERRHDCHSGVCRAIGIMGHNICKRGTPLIYVDADHPQKFYCNWKKNVSPQVAFEKAYPVFATDFREQFKEYTLRMTACINGGESENQCIQDWNPNESGRIAKVTGNEDLVRSALGM